ncbi:response regulator [Pseudoduganella umbonata]|uniref:Sensory/regulatory protein RpfC n=1 Tax=Pseudoduganella umbonata TaxID=864828 RepID=A0A4P8I0Q0_9BURK|nr:response regulator [Pseudoduganella umbonata]MBB3221837.1 PAS domain S-box-containing protein [Pseudoduganella umbonata]QCP14355.1 response regulator [Pseudoduganella umbonata]
MIRRANVLHTLRDAWRRDIVLRLAVSIFLAVALSTAAYTTYAVRTLHAEAELQLQERSERLVTVLSQALARPLFDINGAAITSVVDAMRATPEVLMLRVLAPNGTELAGFGTGKYGAASAITVHRDISFQDGARNYKVGAIDLTYSRRETDQALQRQLLNALMVNLLLALTIVGSVFVVARKAVRPFGDIQKSLEKLAQGKTDIQLSGIGRADQVGRLSIAVRSFRDTLTRLRYAESELRELNGDLEQKIDTRTQELKRTIAAARDSERKLRAIVDTALDAVVNMDRNGRVVGWNRQAEMIFGYARDEALGQQLDTLIIPPRYRDDHRKGMARYLAGDGPGEVLDRRIEVEALHADGTEFPIELSITRIDLDAGEFEFCGFIRDISERREREQKLVAANVRAEAANIAKSEFLANMSHEIRTPMSAIIGMAYLALRTDLNTKQHDYVSKIHRAALALLGIINDILDFSKIEAGRLEVEQVPFFLDEVLANVASVTSQRAAEKQLEYLFNVPPSIPRHLVGDPLRLGQVLINLVNNAVKFTPQGELELCCTQMPSPGPAHGAGADRVVLRFSVRDTGIGMPEEQMGKLFRAFNQADGSTSRQFGGTGLGLSISQQLVRLMGGSIRVESEQGRGSVFSFALEFGLSGQPERSPVVPAALNNARVLLVDDSPVALEVLGEAARALPLRVQTASSGAEALAGVVAADAAADPYALVLTDWQMPGMDGIELARRVAAAPLERRPGMVLLTAFGREEVQREAEDAGFVGYLFKPIGQSVLVDTLVALFSPPRRHGRPVDAGKPGMTGRVLLVEDNPVNQQIAAELMGIQGIAVEFAGNGREALDRLAQVGPGHYDLLLMDLEMPLLDGHETTLELRRDRRFDGLPVIAMTAHALADVRERCLAEGMQDYVTKPIDPDMLYATLARWLGRAMPPVAPRPPRLLRILGQDGLPLLPGIDTARGLRHVAGNETLYLQLLDRFRNSQRDAANEVATELLHCERDAARKRAHTLRGVAGNVGANAVEAAARAIEELLDGGEVPAATLVEELSGALRTAIAGLDAHFATTPGAGGEAGTGKAGAVSGAEEGTAAEVQAEVQAKAALAKLRELLAAYSGDSNDYFAGARAALVAVLSPPVLERVAAHIASYEFDAARQALDAAAPETP